MQNALVYIISIILIIIPVEIDNVIAVGDKTAAVDTVNQPAFGASRLGGRDLERIAGVSWRDGCPVPTDDLRILNVTYVGFDGRRRAGELVCHYQVAGDLLEIFKELYEAEFPIGRVRLVDEYGADDVLSMDDNNTSAFNYRKISGSAKLSRHAYGLAIDINPVQNPYVESAGDIVQPEAGRAYLDRGNARPGMIVPGNPAHKAFISRGWTWGGDWKNQKDYQHFQKDIIIQ